MWSILRVFRYTRRYPWLATSTIGFAVLATLMVIVFPGVTQRIIDDAIRGNHPDLIVPQPAARLLRSWCKIWRTAFESFLTTLSNRR
jgi:hypothetical protein